MLKTDKIINNIKQVFIQQDKYLFDKHVPEFFVDGKFLGDFFGQLAVEPRGTEPPIFYYTYSPFDVISNQAPHRASVFTAGEMLLEIDFDKYTAMRTAAMSACVLPALGVSSLLDKRVLLFGAGRIACESVKFLKSKYPELEEIACVSKSGNLQNISKFAEDLGVSIVPGETDNIGQYDVIICHTQAEQPILADAEMKKLKEGAIICSFISSTEHGELNDNYFDTAKANIVCDWELTLKGAKELGRSVENGRASKNEIIYLGELLSKTKLAGADKRYTIYRSTGTPLQNLAVLQMLLEK